ncbi:MAG: PEGA domain-containing protein [Myxococcaceae bacterium]
MEPPEKDEDEFEPLGPAMDASGQLEGQSGAAPRAPLRHRPPRAEPLELAERPPRPETDFVPPPPPPKPRLPSGGGTGGPALVLLLLAIAGAGGWYFFLRSKTPANRVPVAVVVFITSEPLGASVSVEGTPVGVTPWAADNIWPPGPVNVTVARPGYRPWSGTFHGGRPARLEVRLQRR